MAKRGTYNGGGTVITGRDAAWFGRKSTSQAGLGPACTPGRSPEEEAEFQAFKAARAKPGDGFTLSKRPPGKKGS